MIRTNRGITLTSLVAAIIIMLILTATIITNTYTGSDYKKYKLMCADVNMLEDKCVIYKNKYGDLPILDGEGAQVVSNLPTGTNDLHEFWKIDKTKLDNITLNYGKEEDVFIIDTTTLEVFYLNGIEYNGEIYYR